MGHLEYATDLSPILVFEPGESGPFIQRELDECSSTTTHFYNHNRFKGLVLEFGGLHAVRAVRVWRRLILAEKKSPPPKPTGGFLAFTPETDFGTPPAPPFHPNCSSTGYVSEEEADKFFAEDDGEDDDDEEAEPFDKWLRDDEEDDGEEDEGDDGNQPL